MNVQGFQRLSSAVEVNKWVRGGHRPEVQHQQNHHDHIVCHKAAAEKAADDVHNYSSYLQGASRHKIITELCVASKTMVKEVICPDNHKNIHMKASSRHMAILKTKILALMAFDLAFDLTFQHFPDRLGTADFLTLKNTVNNATQGCPYATCC